MADWHTKCCRVQPSASPPHSQVANLHIGQARSGVAGRHKHAVGLGQVLQRHGSRWQAAEAVGGGSGLLPTAQRRCCGRSEACWRRRTERLVGLHAAASHQARACDGALAAVSLNAMAATPGTLGIAMWSGPAARLLRMGTGVIKR